MYGAVRERGGRAVPFDGRCDRPRVGGARLFKVDKRQNLPRKWRPTQNDVLPQTFLARFALQPLIVDDLDAFQLRLAQSEIHGKLYHSGFRQNTAYKGIDFILFSYPKFRVERRMEYFGE